MMPQDSKDLKEYADGWITERKGTDVPAFLKVAFMVITLGCLGYFFVYMNGEVNHADRGKLVQQLNDATQSSPVLMYFVAALGVIYLVILGTFVFRKFHEE